MKRLLLLISLSACATGPDSKEPAEEPSDISNQNQDEQENNSETDSADPDDAADDEQGETGLPDDAGDDTDDDQDSEGLPAIHLPGPHTVSSSPGTFETTADCTLSYTRYEPSSGEAIGEAFIFHGFMRGQEQFSDLGKHLASWGVNSTTVRLCHSTFVDVDTVQNSRDVVEFARSLEVEKVVWMGQSNGGVSALIAGGVAPDITAGILGLDPVESFAGGGTEWAGEVTSPTAALFGIPDDCNSDNSGRAPFAATAGSVSLRISEADHCSFEFPTNGLCQLACERDKPTFSNAELDRTILELSTAWTLARLDDTFDAAPWWSVTGSQYSNMISTGAISPL